MEFSGVLNFVPYEEKMQRVLIIGNSGGIGAALETEYTSRQWSCEGVSRSYDGLDFKYPETVALALGKLKPSFQTIIIATGALTINGYKPEKTIRAISADGMAEQMQINAIGPAVILSNISRLLAKDCKSRVAVLSARVGSIGDNRLGGWISYRAAKAALNQIVHTASIEFARSHPQSACFSLHPGTVETPLTKEFITTHQSKSPSATAVSLFNVIESIEAKDTGCFFDQNGLSVAW